VSTAALDAPASRSLQREVITPEGVALRLTLAARGSRLAAFLIDMVIIVGAMVAVAFVGSFIETGSSGAGHRRVFFDDSERLQILLMVSFFLLRTGYFTWFELKWHGKTPGKRALNIQVIDRRGGTLTADAVLARNLTREVETFLPFALLMSGPAGEAGWVTLCMVGWLSAFFLLPLFTRNIMRVGDFIGGTWVIEIPRVVLAPDLAVGEDHYKFTSQQLRIYGINELHLLEEVLRRDDRHSAMTLGEVRRRIQRKIGWEAPNAEIVDDRRFLTSYYKQLRAELERGALRGRRRQSKLDPYKG
jgi:uncharacterized RDD family membrane protein YckC